MVEGLIGRKLGMTQVLDGEGRRVAVTVIEAGPCVVVQRKTAARDGYDAVQLGFGRRSARRTGKAQAGHLKRAGVESCARIREVAPAGDASPEAGQTVDVTVFEGVTHVDVTGISKGRGFQGVVKRHNMRGGPKTHGGHSVRRVGSIGQCSYPARVAKGQRMPGHMGRVRVTQQNLQVVGIRGEDNLLLVKGAVAGPSGGMVMVRRARKKR
ncbi:MAG: 50S ribosomal protein L3 [Lentisphaerae bacterium]|nr:50S ribosomal protein L3 [Lentisphaerota bacterium]